MSGLKVEFSVLNLLATPGLYAAAFANRPAAGYPGRIFIDTDNPSTGMYRDTGTVWVQIAETAAADTDTLQIVTDRGNTTTNSITVGASSTPAGTIDVRRQTAALNNSNDYAFVSVNTPTVTAGASFGNTNINAAAALQSVTFSSNATLTNQNITAAGYFQNTIGNTNGGTITVNQSGTIRAISAISAFSYYNTLAATTITHNSAIRTGLVINSGAGTATVTNNYQVLINDSTPISGAVTYTNRWGIYQEGTSDKNYFAANVLIKSTTDNGNALQVTGQANFTSNVGIGTSSPATKLTVYGGYANFTDGTIDIYTGSDGSGGLFGTASNHYQRFITDNTERMRITSGGELLINTTTDVGDFKLQVSGNAYVSGNVGINTTSPNASAILEINSITQGLLIPRMTTTQRDNIATPAVGLLIFNTTTNRLNIYDGAWIAVH